MAVETEIKLLVPEKMVTKIAQLPFIRAAQKHDTQHLLNWYFDTPDLRLSADKVALRIREQEGAYIQTLKTKGNSINGLHQRGEWEWLIAKPQLDMSLLLDDDCPFVIKDNDLVKELEVIFSTNFDRSIWMLEWPENDVLIEVALDQGEVSYTSPEGATYIDKICELELELKSGQIEHLVRASSLFTDAIPELVLSNISKAERGYKLFQQAYESRTKV